MARATADASMIAGSECASRDSSTRMAATVSVMRVMPLSTDAAPISA